MKITITELKPEHTPFFKKSLNNYKLTLLKEPITEQNINQFISKIKDTEILSVFIASIITKDIIKKLPKLKLIATRSTGFDHIDLEECKKRKITVCNVPVYGDNTIAEHTFALILSLARKIIPSIQNTRRCCFDLEGLQGIDLKNKTIGIIGTGKIGMHVARISNGFGMEVIAHDAFPNKKLAKELGFVYTSLNNLLEKSDIITLHVPLIKTTRHLLNKKNIAKIKKQPILINTSRGPVIETDALFLALRKKIISAAGLDILEDEFDMKKDTALLEKKHYKKSEIKILLEQHMLLESDNVIITPHNAFNTKEAVQRINDTTIQNIKEFVKGKNINLVG